MLLHAPKNLLTALDCFEERLTFLSLFNLEHEGIVGYPQVLSN